MPSADFGNDRAQKNDDGCRAFRRETRDVRRLRDVVATGVSRRTHWLPSGKTGEIENWAAEQSFRIGRENAGGAGHDSFECESGVEADCRTISASGAKA